LLGDDILLDEAHTHFTLQKRNAIMDSIYVLFKHSLEHISRISNANAGSYEGIDAFNLQKWIDKDIGEWGDDKPTDEIMIKVIKDAIDTTNFSVEESDIIMKFRDSSILPNEFNDLLNDYISLGHQSRRRLRAKAIEMKNDEDNINKLLADDTVAKQVI
jgi:hypothetical protein